jgi:predicted membrane protein
MVDQISRFAIHLGRMNDERMARRSSRKRRALALIVAILVALVAFWIVKDVPARVAATILQAEAVPASW